jgi:phosphatidylserine/phosphatidylglycerophosphate/cardiolipin synthase-like enzyme
MHRSSHSPLERFKTHLNAEYHSAELCIWFFPRRRSDPHFEVLNDRSLKYVRVAASHFRDPTITRLLIKLAGRGTQVEVLCHDSFRRVPYKVERLLRQGGVGFWRYRHEDGVPMHNKFMLLESANEATVLFGSLNLTRTSRLLNHEILMKSSNRELFSAFSMRWQQMHSEIRIRGSAA